jgi:hypothetical protein
MNRMSGWKRKADIPGIAFFRSETDLPHPVDPVHPVEKWLDPVPGLCQRPCGESGPALVPSQPDASPLYRLVKSGEMPKRDRKPSAAEIELLRRWIESGAPTARDEPDFLPAGMHITAEEAVALGVPTRRNVPRCPPRQPGDADPHIRSTLSFATALRNPKDLAFSPGGPAAHPYAAAVPGSLGCAAHPRRGRGLRVRTLEPGRL